MGQASWILGPGVRTPDGPALFPNYDALKNSGYDGPCARMTFSAAPRGFIAMVKRAGIWRPEPDQVIAEVMADIPLVAAGISYVQLWSVDLSNLVQAGSILEFAPLATCEAGTAASSIGSDRGGVGKGIGSPRTVTSGQIARRVGCVEAISATQHRFVTSGDISWAGTTGATETVDPANLQFGFGFTPGEVGAQLTLRAGSYIRMVA